MFVVLGARRDNHRDSPPVRRVSVLSSDYRVTSVEHGEDGRLILRCGRPKGLESSAREAHAATA
jgi:hypothetical protein